MGEVVSRFVAAGSGAGRPLDAGGVAMKVFVTGATGVIGGPTVARLIEAGHEVRAVSRARGGGGRIARRRRRARQPSISSTRPRSATRWSGSDAIAHLATNVPPFPKLMRAERVGDAQPAAHRDDALPRRRGACRRRRPHREGVDHLHLRGRRRRVARRDVAAHREPRADAACARGRGDRARAGRRPAARRSRSDSASSTAAPNRGTDEMLRLAKVRGVDGGGQAAART